MKLCLVEVLMVRFKKGTETYLDWINEFDITVPRFEESIVFKEDERNQYNPFSKPDTKVEADFIGFSFRHFGQSFDDLYSSGLDFESQHIGNDEVFNGWEENLKKLGDFVIENKKEQGLIIDGNQVRFVTVWEYNSWVNSYNGEFDSDWSLLGLLNIDLLDNEKIVVFPGRLELGNYVKNYGVQI